MNEFDDEDISRSSACFFLDLRCPLKAVGRMARSAGRGNPANICFRFQIPPTARILPLLNGKLKGKASTIFNLQLIHKKLQDACCQRNMCQKIVEAYLIFVIFFTLAKFLENKIYTEKRQFFALNL